MHVLGDIAMLLIHFHTLFDHIFTNLLTQCTTVPVPVFCCLFISGFPLIKSSPKIPEKSNKNQREATSLVPPPPPLVALRPLFTPRFETLENRTLLLHDQ